MGTALADAVKAKKSVQIGEKEMAIRPLELNDYGCWDRWARASHLKACTDAAVGLDQNTQRTMLREAQDMATRIYFGSPRALGLLLSLESKLLVIGMALSTPETEVSKSDAWKLFCNADNQPDFVGINAAWEEILILSGLRKKSEGSPENPQTLVSSIIALLS